MRKVKKSIGIDLGGTNVRCGMVENSNLFNLHSSKLTDKDNKQAVIDQITSLISETFDRSVEAIGIGVPSVVDPVKGIVYDTTNIPSWKEVHLKDELEAVFHVPVSVNNDANCFTLGEKYFGKAAGYKNIVGITLGTGVGAGLVLNDKLYLGNNCGAGEYGMAPFRDANFERYCSGEFFDIIKGVSAIEMYHAALTGDHVALGLFKELGDNLSYLMKNVIYTLDPEVIVLGGSISKAYQFFSESMFKGLVDFGFPTSLDRLKIVVSELDNSGVLGASQLENEVTIFEKST